MTSLWEHTVTDYERDILAEEDDRRWYDLIVRYEKNRWRFNLEADTENAKQGVIVIDSK